MTTLRINTAGGRTAFAPGDTISGEVSWSIDESPRSAEMRLFWYTRGKGTQDVGVVATQRFDLPKAQDQRTFSLDLPDSPYSFSGKLISLLWAMELVMDPGPRIQRLELVVGPGGQEVLLGQPAATPP